jgi:hypothetical protein
MIFTLYYVWNPRGTQCPNFVYICSITGTLGLKDTQGGEDISPENEEVYEKASEAEAAEEIEAGDADDEAEDVETKELLRNGEAEAPNRTACLRGRRPAPIAADAEGRTTGSAARSDSMRQVEAEIAGEGEVEAKAAIGGGGRASGRVWVGCEAARL